MNHKSYFVIIGPTKAQEKNKISYSGIERFPNHKTAVRFLNEECERQEKGERRWVALKECEHLHDENNQWYGDEERVLMTVYM